jgi:hypothetical protein
MPNKTDQTTTMKVVLFWVFTGLFVIIVFLTLLSVFFGIGSPTPAERDVLFKAFIVEIGIAVVALFYALFNLKQTVATKPLKVRLDFGELIDIKQLIAKTAICSFILENGDAKDNVKYRILDDNGLYLSLDFPKGTQNVFVSVQTDSKIYSGSFPADSYRVQMA